MQGFKFLAAGVAALCLAGPARAAVSFENLSADYYANTIYFPGVAEMIPVYGVNNPVGTGFSQSTNILGGERDVRVEILNSVGYAGDNNQASAKVGLGIQNGFFFTSFGVGAGGKASFIVQYDGIDGAMSLGSGLNLNLAAVGDRISLTTYTNYVLHSQPDVSAPTDLVIRLTDMAGKSASITRTASASGAFETLDYGFAAFEAANNQLNLRSIRAIELLATISQESYLDGGIGILNLGTGGGVYTPTNQILPPGAGEPLGGVPEPATWALMIGGFGLAGAGLRRRRAVASNS